MKKLLKFALLGALTISFTAQAATMKELEQRIEDLEYNSYEDIFRFSGMLEMRYDTVSAENKKTDTKSTDQMWRMWADIDMEAKATEKLSFYGRLSMAKRLNGMAKADGGDVETLEEGQSVGYGSSEIYLQRAFVNYQFRDNLAFTFGRLPTANGAPSHLTRDEGVDGAYPFYLYNAFLDGMALSYGFAKNFNAKFVYTPFQFSTDEATPTTTNLGTNERTDGGTFSSPNSSFAAIIEYKKQNLSWARKFFTSLSYLNGSVPFYIQNTAVIAAGPPPTIGNTGVANIEVVMKKIVFNMEVNDFMKSNFDFNIQVMNQKVSSKGHVETPFGNTYFLSNSGKAASSTAGVFTGRYTFNAKNKAGFQYSTGSQHTFSTNLVGKNSIATDVPGSSYHLFYNHTFSGGLKMNVGYIASQVDYEAPIQGILGERAEADIKNEAIYTSFIANF